MKMRCNPAAAGSFLILALSLLALSGVAHAETQASRKVGVGVFIKLSEEDFKAFDPGKADLAWLKKEAESQGANDPLGLSLSRLSFERLARPAPWKAKTEASQEIEVTGSLQEFVPLTYDKNPGEIVAAFYSYDGAKIRLLPFLIQKDSTSLRTLPGLAGEIRTLDDLVSALVLEFQEGLLDRALAPGESVVTGKKPAVPRLPESFSLSSRLDWKHEKDYGQASRAFYGALGRFVAGVSLSALSAGTYFLYSEAYSRSAASAASVYASGGAAIACLAASAVFAVQSVVGFSRLLSYSR